MTVVLIALDNCSANDQAADTIHLLREFLMLSLPWCAGADRITRKTNREFPPEASTSPKDCASMFSHPVGMTAPCHAKDSSERTDSLTASKSKIIAMPKLAVASTT